MRARKDGQGVKGLWGVGLLVGMIALGLAAGGRAQAPVASLRLSVNTLRVALGGILRVDLATENPTAGARADLYAGVLVPGGALVFRRADGTFSGAPAALAAGAPVAAGTTRILDLPVPTNLPAGSYTFLAAYIRAGAVPAQANLASNLASIDVSVGPSTVSFRGQVRPIFNANCALSGCHVPPFPTGSQDLLTDPYRAIVDQPALEFLQGRTVPRIDPGRPDSSYMLQKLLGTPGIEGDRMPQGRPPLPQALIDTIRTWTSEGAPNN